MVSHKKNIINNTFFMFYFFLHVVLFENAVPYCKKSIIIISKDEIKAMLTD